MRKSKIKQISLAVCLAFIPLYGFAAGLGKLNINSGLGEPLSAEVELLSVTAEELATLEARIAPEEAYDVQGISRLGIHNNIKVELAKNSSGAPVLKLRSNQPVSDPYLDVLIQVDWATGRLMREYTVLLDPPGYKASISEASTPLVSAPSTASSTPVNAKPTQQATKKSNISSTKKSSQPVDTSVTTDSAQLMTVRGDTLSSIAKEMQVEGVSLDQMLVGLFENNKEAFFNGNMNRLKVGQIIKAPSKDVLITVSPQQAKQAIKIHSANWNEYRSSLAGTVDKTPVAEESEQKQSASGKIATAEDISTPIKSGPKDVVKLSAGEKSGEKNAQDFDAKILALQEEATARENTLKESQARMAALEQQIQDMQKLLALKNQAMTELQQNSQAVANQSPAETAPVVAVKPTPVAVSPVAEVVPEHEPTFMDSLPEGVDITMLGGAAGVALLGAGWMFLRNKRRRDLDSFERGILTSGGLRANTVFGNTTGSASTSDTSFLTDFAQSADGSMIDTHDVDPIAEAEVYMAYGRDAQAEEILKDAISKEPKRYELHLKLLEMYAGRKDVSAFEAIAGELYTTLGADDPTWIKVAEMGITVEPDNPLYDLSNVTSSNTNSTGELDSADFDSASVSVDEGLDFSLDSKSADIAQPEVDDANSAIMESFSAAENIESEKPFDMGSIEDEPVTNDLSLADNTAAVGDDFSADSLFKESADKDASIEDVEQAVDDLADVDSDLQEKGVASDNSLDFDLSGFNIPESTVTNVGVDETVTDLSDLDLPDLNLAELEGDDSIADLDVPTSDHDATESAQPASDLNFYFSNQEANVAGAEEISFDLPSVDEVAASSATEADEPLLANESDANAFDFSAISLDLGDDDAEAAVDDTLADLTIEPMANTEASENQDVDIKLDLVAAYIDMDDKEGARELLDEIVKEGGPQQQKRAEQLLASLA